MNSCKGLAPNKQRARTMSVQKGGPHAARERPCAARVRAHSHGLGLGSFVGGIYRSSFGARPWQKGLNIFEPVPVPVSVPPVRRSGLQFCALKSVLSSLCSFSCAEVAF